jgi:hypothetical protein
VHVLGHCGYHGNGTCRDCGVVLTLKNACPVVVQRGSGPCKRCSADSQEKRRRRLGIPLVNIQAPGAAHKFPCGCSGILPEKRGQSSTFAIWGGHGWSCRVKRILISSSFTRRLKVKGYVPIDPDTPHATIRALMEEPNCERCGQPLSWNDLGKGKTPPLHHNNATGEIYGFTHLRCNTEAMEQEIERLKNENRKLRAAKFAA